MLLYFITTQNNPQKYSPLLCCIFWKIIIIFAALKFFSIFAILKIASIGNNIKVFVIEVALR